MQENIAFIIEMDLSFAKRELIAEGYSAAEADQAIAEYRAEWLAHARNPDVVLTPSDRADKVGHSHMCRPVRYRADSIRAFNAMLDHDPDAPADVVALGWANTQRLAHSTGTPYPCVRRLVAA